MSTEDENRPIADEPVRIGERLQDGLPVFDAAAEKRREHETKLKELGHEVGGIVAEREMTIEEYAISNDPAVGEAVRRQTQDLLEAQADLNEEQQRGDTAQ